MKQLFTLLTITFSFFMMGQTVLLEDFSSSPSTEGFEGLGSATIVADPVTSGNGDGLQLVTSATGQLWQGANVMLAAGSYANISTFKTLTMDVYSTTGIHLYAEIHDTTFGNDMQGNTQTHSGSGWETLTFTYSAANGTFTKIAVFPNRNAAGDGFNDPVVQATIVIDNIKSGEAAPTNQNGLQDGDETGVDCGGSSGTDCPSTPSDSPAAPTRDATDVISVFSDAYTDVATNYNPGWGQAGTVNTAYDTGDGNNLLVYSNFNYQGTELASSDISGMEYLHVDIWVASNDTRTVKVTPIGGGETLVAVTTTPGAWNSVDIPVSSFTGVTTPEAVTQLKFDGQFAADGATADTGVRSDIYLDNIYFYKSPTASINDIEGNVNIYPNPVQNTLNVSAAVAIDAVSIFDLTGREVLRAMPKAESFSLDVSNLNKGLYLVTVKAGKQELTTKLVK